MSKESTKKESRVPVNETKAEKSVRLANMRVNNAKDKIRLVQNLTTSAYEFTPEQKQKIVNELSDAVVSVANNFDRVKPEKARFSL